MALPLCVRRKISLEANLDMLSRLNRCIALGHALVEIQSAFNQVLARPERHTNLVKPKPVYHSMYSKKDASNGQNALRLLVCASSKLNEIGGARVLQSQFKNLSTH